MGRVSAKRGQLTFVDCHNDTHALRRKTLQRISLKGVVSTHLCPGHCIKIDSDQETSVSKLVCAKDNSPFEFQAIGDNFNKDC